MVNKKSTLTKAVIPGPCDGGGQVHVIQLIESDEDLCGKGRMFNHLTLEPGAGVGYHTHTGDSELYYILSGTGIYNDNGEDVAVCAGDVMLCKPGEGHALKNTGAAPMDFIALIVYA